jgi:hypothetical protein
VTSESKYGKNSVKGNWHKPNGDVVRSGLSLPSLQLDSL